MMQTLAQRVKAKYPEYNDMNDQELEAKIKAKYPGEYDDLPTSTPAPEKPKESPGFFSRLGEAASNAIPDMESLKSMGKMALHAAVMPVEFQNDMMRNSMDGAARIIQDQDKGVSKPASVVREVGRQLGVPSDAIAKDYEERNYRGLAGDLVGPVLTAGLMEYGTRKLNPKVSKPVEPLPIPPMVGNDIHVAPSPQTPPRKAFPINPVTEFEPSTSAITIEDPKAMRQLSAPQQPRALIGTGTPETRFFQGRNGIADATDPHFYDTGLGHLEGQPNANGTVMPHEFGELNPIDPMMATELGQGLPRRFDPNVKANVSAAQQRNPALPPIDIEPLESPRGEASRGPEDMPASPKPELTWDQKNAKLKAKGIDPRTVPYLEGGLKEITPVTQGTVESVGNVLSGTPEQIQKAKTRAAHQDVENRLADVKARAEANQLNNAMRNQSPKGFPAPEPVDPFADNRPVDPFNPKDMSTKDLLKEGKKITARANGVPDIAPPNKVEVPLNTADPRKNPTFVEKWKNLLYGRKAASIRGKEIEKQFSHLDSDGIVDFNNKLNQGMFPEVKQFFDDQFARLKEAVPQTGYKEGYLTLLFKDDPAKVVNMQKKLGLRPSFTLESRLKDYQALVDAGLTPLYDKPSQVLGHYAAGVDKVVANAEFFKYLKEAGHIVNDPKARGNKNPQGLPEGWGELSGDYFPKDENGQRFHASAETRQLLDNYFKKEDTITRGGIVSKAAKTVSFLRQLKMESGIPFTALNMHTTNLLVKYGVKGSQGGVIKNLAAFSRDLLRPEKAQRNFESNLGKLRDAVKDGRLNTSIKDVEGFKSTDKGLRAAFQNATHEVFGKKLFDQVLPDMMLREYEAHRMELQKQGMAYNEAAIAAGEHTNRLFGALDPDAMMKNPNSQAFLRAVALAPTWAETNLYHEPKAFLQDVAKNTPKGVMQRRAAWNLAKMWASIQVINYISSGQTPVDTGGFSLALGKDSNGKDRSIRLGTGLDAVRLPFELAMKIAEKDADMTDVSNIVKNRLSPVAQAGLTFASGRNNFGQPLKSIGDHAENLFNALGPQYATYPVQALRGKISPEEALAGTFELPTSYKKKPAVKPFFKLK